MAFSFKETFEITLPDMERSLDLLESTDTETKKGLIVEVAAIHVGATANFNYYTEEALEESISSWTEPYPKPVILNHDPFSESVGRIIGARMDTDSDGTPFVRLQAAITDPEAIQKIKDKRFLTGSVGGKATEAACSICGSDWAAQESDGAPCRHRKGKVYNGKVAFLKLGKLKFKEYSWVNMPADERSQVLSVSEGDSHENIDAAECFILNMESQEVNRVTESGVSDVLDGMKKKEALPIYMGLKGSFLTALALNENEESTNLTKDIENSETNNTNTDSNKISEENFMPKTVEQTEEKDLLDVVEGLAAEEEAEDTTTDDAASDEVADDKADADTASDDTDASDGAEAEDADAETNDDEDEAPADEAEGDKKPEGQEKGGDNDVDPDTSAGAPPSREGEEEEEASDEEGEDSDAETEAEDTDSDDPELVDEGEADEVDEPQESEEDSSELTKLKEENARLRKALHRMLAERVVDAKIAAGIDVEDRKSAIAEHAERTADSLADSLRDLATLRVNPDTESKDVPTLESEIAAVEDGGTQLEEDEDVKENDEEVEADPVENFFVDALMGRKPL